MREITLPPVHNKRSPAQWEIVSKHVDFKGKTVLDLGCGYADLLWRCWQAGASSITGIDQDDNIITHNWKTSDSINTDGHYGFSFFWSENIESYIAGRSDDAAPDDIILCFSVLPYLEDPVGTLGWIYSHSRIALLEVQYFGDGPGPVDLQDDYDMEYQLEMTGWQSITPIGTTYIPDRDKHRTIWMCKG